MRTDINNAATVATTDAAFIGPVQPAATKPAKPVKAAKPAKPRAAKPAAAPDFTDVIAADPLTKTRPLPADNAAAIAADEQRCADLRALAAKYYNGASNAAHQRKPAKRDEYAKRVTTPVQRIGTSGPSPRDESGLALILSGAKRDGSFDPCALNLDLGIASRLASVGFLAFASDTFTLTKPGRERANIVVKRAA